MSFLTCSLVKGFHDDDLPQWQGVASRVLPGQPGEAATVQTLVACNREVRPLTGANALGSLELGPPLQLFAEPAAREGAPAAARRRFERAGTHGFSFPVWDPFSSSVYVRHGSAIFRLSSDNTLTLVAGAMDEEGAADGPGGTARFVAPCFLASDGAGSLYLADGDRIRKLQLPRLGVGRKSAHGGESLPAAAVGGGPAASMAAAAAGDRVSGGGPAATAASSSSAACQAAAGGGEVLASTLPFAASTEIVGLAVSGSRCSGSVRDFSGSLLFGTDTALYRLPLGDPVAAPLLLAGAEGEEGEEDGCGTAARFASIYGIALDGEGSAYVADWRVEVDDEGEETYTTCLRRVLPDGTVTTIGEGLGERLGIPDILPNGCLAFSSGAYGGVHVLGLGLKLPAWHPAVLAQAAPTGPPPRTLPADLGALLDRQPDGTADLTIVVGNRTFHVHRALLSARSDYFLSLLGGDFTEGSAQQLSLPDADPDAFELWLRFVYTGAADIPAGQAVAVAELSDRLLLPELREQATAVVEASVSTGTVVGLLLWAEARGFSGLRSRLKGWFIENHESVMREAEEQVDRLAVESPRLFLELMRGTHYQPSKRPRAS